MPAVTAAHEGRQLGLRVVLALVGSGSSASADQFLRLVGRRSLLDNHAVDPGETGGTADWSASFRQFGESIGRGSPPAIREDLAGSGIVLVETPPVFVGRDAIEVNGEKLRFRKAVLAIGRSASIEQGNSGEIESLLPEVFVGLNRPPQRLAILGCGPRACIWAQALRRFGSEVLLISPERSLLPDENPLAGAVVERQLALEGVQMFLGGTAVAVGQTGGQRMVVVDQEGQREKHFVDRVFREVATAPDLGRLQLDKAKVAWDARGIKVNRRLRTTNRRVFAGGGVCGEAFDRPEAALVMARLCVHNAFHCFRKRVPRTVIPRYVWTDPEVAEVGITPAEAAAQQIEIDTYRAEISEVATSRLAGRAEGFLVIYTRHGTARILGGVAVAECATELIGTVGLLMAQRISLDALAESAACLPSRLEVLALMGDYYRRNRPRSRWQIMGTKLHGRWKRLWRSVSA
ncbi:MAG: FAD-dependent oxidoreductase [Rhodopirellula sp.]|nr:FAD-dependent oxidoreductase [Rhodopirellula sp.]